MKHCIYCNTDYSPSENRCPSCSSPDAKIKCDQCGTIHDGTICPNCGFGKLEELRVCPKCGGKTGERVCPKCGHDIASTATIKESVASVASKAACKLTGHKWLGCKCTRCGTTRDEGHNFELTHGKCEQRCTVCQKVENIPHQWDGEKCIRCGKKKESSEKFWESVGKRLPFFRLEKANNRVLFGLGAFLIVGFLFMGIIGSCEESGVNRSNHIAMPASSSDFTGERYQDVVDMLREAGFTNIETEALGDLLTGFLHDEGDVDEVKVGGIGGDTDFPKGSSYPLDVDILVSYHSYPQAEESTPSQSTTSESTSDSVAVVESTRPTEPPTTESTTQPITTASAETEVNEAVTSLSATYKYEGPAYEIVVVQENIAYDSSDMNWVLTDKLNYSTDEYRDIVKAIISDVVYNANTDVLEVAIVTNEDIIEFETNLNSLEEHGQEWYNNALAVEETDWVAWYSGGFDSVTLERSDADSAFEIAWLLSTDIDPDSQSIELWRPEL